MLVKQEKYQDALALAQSFYNAKAKAVVGLSGGPNRRRQAVADKVAVYTNHALFSKQREIPRSLVLQKCCVTTKYCLLCTFY